MSNMAEHINKEQKKKGEEKQETENKKEEETYESLKRKGFNVPKPSFCEMQRAGTIKGGHHPKGFVDDVKEDHEHLKDLIDQLGTDKGAKRREQKALKGECKYCFKRVIDRKRLEKLRMEERMMYQAGKLGKPRRKYKMGKDEDPGMDEDPICDVASLFDISIDSEGFKEMDMDVIGDLRYADDEFKDPDDNLSGPLQRLTTQALALSGASRASWLGSGAPAAGQAVDGGGEAKNFLSSGGLMKTSGENAGIREAGTTLPILSENDEQTSGTPSPSQGETLPESAAQN